jgi:aryl-alcohol dehydrogenase-like predicted oxidoreductase
MTEFAHLPDTILLGDLRVCRLGFGAMQLPGPMVWGEPKDPAAARAVLRGVVERGINLIDTSWYYGPHVANQLIAEALHPYPEGLVIATKLGGKRLPDKGWAAFIRPEELRQGCEEDLRTLRRDHIDVVHLRWIPHGGVTFDEALGAMIALKQEGKIRHIGLSNVSVEQVEAALQRTPIADVQNLYNVAAGEGRLARLPHAQVEGQERLLALCEARGIAFMPFFPLAIPGMRLENAALSQAAARHGKTEAQIAIAWLLAHSKVMLPIPGTSSPDHLSENWAARQVKLSDEEIASIRAAR